VSAALFGAMTVAVRIGFRYENDAALATFSTVTWALAMLFTLPLLFA